MRLVCRGAVGWVRPASLLEGLCSQDLHPTWQACLGHSPEAFRLPRASVSALLNSPS